LDMSKEWMSTECQKRLLEMKMTGKRPRCIPRTSWLDIKRDIRRKDNYVYLPF
jgi:hypothetical protein